MRMPGHPKTARLWLPCFCSPDIVRPPPRKVPGRRGMTYTEEGWIDEETTSHRGPGE